MKKIKIFALSASLIIIALGAAAFIKANNNKSSNKKKADDKGFALIELYTSEGCSSCPPADELVAKIEAESKGKPVYILAYHVDYWNRLGWTDQFSSADYSHRQSDYSKYLKLNSVYTPQIIVNGQTEFVGSEEVVLRNAIKTGLQQTPTNQLSLSATVANKTHLDLKYSIEGADKNTVLQVAVLQKNAQTKVLSGENGGHTLSHVQIVRKLQQFKLKGSNGVAGIALPNGFDQQKWEIIGFLQNTKTGAITGAAKASFTDEVNASAMR